MTKQETEEKILSIAMQEAAFWLKNIPKLERVYIFQRIMLSIVKNFDSHAMLLSHVEILEVADQEYQITVNQQIKATLLIEKKEGGYDHN